MNQVMDLVVGGENEGLRLDRFLEAALDGFSRSRLQILIEQGHVTAGGKMCAKNYRVKTGEKICVQIPQPRRDDRIEPKEMSLEIQYEDDDVLVVNKPKGLVVHPAAGHQDDTLVSGLMHYCGDTLSGINGVLRPGIVHRIDKDTSGLLLVAKNDFAHQCLAEQLQGHTMSREYLGVVYGSLPSDPLTVDAPIGRSAKDRKKMAVVRDGRRAVTHCSTIVRYKGFSLVRFSLETGRTHQIRVHMAYMGHPLAGDPAYGPGKAITELGGQCLHAFRLRFYHPRDGREVIVTAPVPESFRAFLKKLNR